MVSAYAYQVGSSALAFKIEQPKTGTGLDNLLIKAGSNNGVTKFQNNAGTVDLLQIEQEVGTNDGMIRVPKIEFGSGIRNRIYNLQDGATNLNLNIQHGSASSEIVFQDNAQDEIMKVRKTEVVLGPTIPIDFGFYEFRPTQYYKDITGFSFNNSGFGSTNIIFSTSDTDWINKNTGSSNQSIDLAVGANQGAYKLSFRQSSGGTLGEINGLRIISDICLTLVNDGAPNITLPSPSSYAFESYYGNAAPIVTMTPGFLVYNVYAQFPGVTGNETANVRITLTQMPYFA